MATIRIMPLDIRHGDFAQLAALRRAQVREDFPQWPLWDPEVTRACLRTSNPLTTVENWVGVVDNRIVAHADMILPRKHNVDTAHVEAIVHPRVRGHGIGKILYRHLRVRAQRAGRSRMLTSAVSNYDDSEFTRNAAGDGFCRSCGMSEVLRSYRRRLDLDTLAEDTRARLRDECAGRCGEYEIITWQDRAPDDIVEDLAYLQTRMSTDAPRGNVRWETTPVDVSRWRGVETMALRRLRTTYYAAALSRETGKAVAWTSLLLNKRPRTHATQQATIVDPQHRGHRLGLAVKLANLDAAREKEPELRYVLTENAEENPHINAINGSLGFEICDVLTTFEDKLD